MHPQIRHSLVITSTGLHQECYCAVVYKQCDISNSKTFLTFSVCIVVWVEGEYIYIIIIVYICTQFSLLPVAKHHKIDHRCSSNVCACVCVRVAWWYTRYTDRRTVYMYKLHT